MPPRQTSKKKESRPASRRTIKTNIKKVRAKNIRQNKKKERKTEEERKRRRMNEEQRRRNKKNERRRTKKKNEEEGGTARSSLFSSFICFSFFSLSIHCSFIWSCVRTTPFGSG